MAKVVCLIRAFFLAFLRSLFDPGLLLLLVGQDEIWLAGPPDEHNDSRIYQIANNCPEMRRWTNTHT